MKRARLSSGSPKVGPISTGSFLGKRKWRVERLLVFLAGLLAASFLLSGQGLQTLSRVNSQQRHRGHRPLRDQQLAVRPLLYEADEVDPIPATNLDESIPKLRKGTGSINKHKGAKDPSKKKRKKEGKKKKPHDETPSTTGASSTGAESQVTSEGGKSRKTNQDLHSVKDDVQQTTEPALSMSSADRATKGDHSNSPTIGSSSVGSHTLAQVGESEDLEEDEPVQEQAPVPAALPLWSLSVAELAVGKGATALVLPIPDLQVYLHIYRGQLVEERWGGLYSLLLLGVLLDQAGDVASPEHVKELRMACLVGSTRVVPAKVTPRAQVAGTSLLLHIECPLAPTFSDPLIDRSTHSRTAHEALILTSAELPVLLKALTGPASPPHGRSVPLAEAPGVTLSMSLRADPTLVHSHKWNLTACVGPLVGQQDEILWVEVIEYQRHVAGVEHFVLYTQEEDHLELPVLKYYESRGVLSLRFWEVPSGMGGKYAQAALVNDCLLQNKHASEWTVFLNAGEFIQVSSQFNYSVQAYLQSLDTKVAHVPLDILRFPMEKSFSQSKYLQLESYQRRIEFPESFRRSIVAPSKVRSIAVANCSVDSYEPLHASSLAMPAPWDVLRVDKYEVLDHKPTAKEDKSVWYFDAPEERLAHWAKFLENKVRGIVNKLNLDLAGAREKSLESKTPSSGSGLSIQES